MYKTAALTKRETDCLDQVRLGHTNAEISDALGMSVATVKKPLCRSYKKLGIRSRTQAIVLLGVGREATC